MNTFLEGLNLNSLKTTEDPIQTNLLKKEECCNCESEGDKVHSHIHFAEKYKIDNILIKIVSKSFSKDDLDKLIGNLLWNDSEKFGFNIIRLKGVIYQKEKILYLQGIYDIYEINELPVNLNYDFETKKEGSKILFIGRNLEKNLGIFNSKFN